MSREITDTIDSIKEISSLLRPSILYDLGLIPAFEWQLKRIETQSGIKCYFKFSPAEILIDDNISLILFRVLQESLTNIVRHSEATVVEIYLRQISNKIDLLIKDNGKGIEESKLSSLSSMGITGIKERIKSVSGNVIIKGEKDTGTIIEVQIPLKKRPVI
jgi:signal transduction histidine kinase